MDCSTPAYTYETTWSEEDGEYVATCVDVPGLSGLAPNAEDAVEELKIAIQGWLAYLDEEGTPASPSRKDG